MASSSSIQLLFLWTITDRILQITAQTTNTTASSTQSTLDYCVGPLVPSSHWNPIQNYGDQFSDCALSCDAGAGIYGLSEQQQQAVDYTTITGTFLCLIGLLVLSYNLYFDLKESKERFIKRPILSHIPYIVSLSTFTLTLLMSISYIIGKDSVICYKKQEFSVWNPAYGASAGCTIFGFFFYSAILFYFFYVLLLSFILWRQFKDPLNALWHIRNRYWHGAVVAIVLILNIVGMATSAVDAIEPMGVCLPGPADRTQLFLFVVLPMLFCCVLSGIFLIWSAHLLKKSIERNKKTVNKQATDNMEDLRKRILFYGFAVLLTLSLLVATSMTFWKKHDTIRKGLRLWIECELRNEFTPDALGMDQDCDALRDDDHRISPFWFTTWTLSCFLGILAQIILSFHAKARKRAGILKQRTLDKIAVQISPKMAANKSSGSKQMNQMAPLSLKDNETEDVESPTQQIAEQTRSTSTLTGSRSSGKGLVQPSVSTQPDSPDELSPAPLHQVKSNSVDED